MNKKTISFLMTILLCVAILSFISCGKAPHTVKVLKGMNNATTLYWAENLQKYGIDYADYDGATILGLALDAKNEELLEAIIKDKADLNKIFINEYGNERYPLSSVTIINMPMYIPKENFTMIKMLLDGGASLTLWSNNTPFYNMLFECIQEVSEGDTEPVFDLFLPYYTKELLNYAYEMSPQDNKQLLGYLYYCLSKSHSSWENHDAVERMIQQM